MAKIQIKNIGPLRDTGVVTLTPVVLVIGPQSSGKSTFMKVLCHCRWLEKMVMVSPEEDVISRYTHNLLFLKQLKQFHRFTDKFFSSDSYFRYEGDAITITLTDITKNVKIERIAPKDACKYKTKLAFIPSERNLISAYKQIERKYKSAGSDVLFNFIFEWGEAHDAYSLDHRKRLSFAPNMEFVNDNGTDMIHLEKEDIMLSTFYASSGVQSAMPVDVMAEYITNLVGEVAGFSKYDLTTRLARFIDNKQDLTTEMLNEIVANMKYQSMQLFVEEPEQNLYPASQRNLILHLIQSLIKANEKGKEESMLVMTTHSPYVLSTLNVLIREADALEQKPDSEQLKRLMTLTPHLSKDSYSAYYINGNGEFVDVIEKELAMISGSELDAVSDWVDNQIAQINDTLYD